MASASLVMGWRLDELCEVRTIEGKKKFDQDTGKPVKNPACALFILGKQVDDPDEVYPCEWSEQLGMEVYSTGDYGDHNNRERLRCYDLKSFVVGVLVASTSETNGNGSLAVVNDFDYLKITTDALNLFSKLCESLDIEKVVEGQLMPRLYIVCYSSH